MRYSYIIQFENGKFYQSKHDYISADYRETEHECDASVITDENDLRYLIDEEIIPKTSRIMIVLVREELGVYPVFVGCVMLVDVAASLNTNSN